MKASAEALPAWRFAAAQVGWPGWLGALGVTVGLLGMTVVAAKLRDDNAESTAAIVALQLRIAHLQDPRAAQASRDPVGTFVASLPPSSAVADFVAAIQRRAEEGSVQIDRTEYRVQPILGQTAQRYRLSFPANSDYPHLRTWLESLLHDYPNLTLDELSLRRAVDGGEELEAHVAVSFLVRDSK